MKDIQLNTTVEQVLRKYPFARDFLNLKVCIVIYVLANLMRDYRLQP